MISGKSDNSYSLLAGHTGLSAQRLVIPRSLPALVLQGIGVRTMYKHVVK